ncbi:uncharacterized protein ycf20 [Malania oleifera]|uniref:uncharacterized protein ycf20 n=1 Tax=Malania oleifera TaxID=397392 RepID=UPI0025ADCC95|nr:uncharacterized protein ycf20 [Malania oleifera]
MVVVTTMALLNYPTNVRFPSCECTRSRFPAVGQRTTFAFSWRLYSQLCFFHVAQPLVASMSKRMAWSIQSTLDGRSDPPTNSSNGRTRLITAIQAIQIKLSERIEEIRKDLPMKLLFFLMGFYCATAFATVIGQTGDWDILSAALAVVVVEGIGALMYKDYFPMFENIRSLITLFNYWKTGLSLGLFLDSFKY